MRRLLFVSYWVPPRKAIGSVRAAHLLKHLHDFGWDVTTLTAQFNGEEQGSRRDWQYVETGYCDLRASAKRIFRLPQGSAHEALGVRVPRYGEKRTFRQRAIFAMSSALSYPDEQAGWLPYAVKGIRQLLSGERWDAILTSAPPMTLNIAAAIAHGSVPWIADFRDLWAQSEYSERSALHAVLDNPLERFSLISARALVASSERSAAHLRCRYPSKPCFAVSTGYDADEWETIPFGVEAQCTFLYAGNWYRGQRDPSLLFAAVSDLLKDGTLTESDLQIDLYAPQEAWLGELIAGYGIARIVRVHGFIERENVLAAQRRADRLIVLSADGRAADGVIAGKVFEYFGARRPILAFGGPEHSTVAELLRDTGAGERPRSVEATKAAVLRAVREHRSGEPRTVPPGAVEAYTGYACARRFAEILDAVAMPSPANTAKYGMVGYR